MTSDNTNKPTARAEGATMLKKTDVNVNADGDNGAAKAVAVNGDANNIDVGMKDVAKAGLKEKPSVGEKTEEKNGKSDTASANNVNKVHDSETAIVGATTINENKAEDGDVEMCAADNGNVGHNGNAKKNTPAAVPASTENGAGGCMSDAAVPPVNTVAGAPVVTGRNSDGDAAPKPYDGPPVNTEIEVLWEITAEDGSAEVTWWKARIQASEYAADKTRMAILLYDSHGEFDEEVVRVTFKSETELIDISRKNDPGGGVLEWRPYDAERKEETITSGELAEGGMEDGSRTVYEAGLQALSTMPADQQAEFAVRYRNFADQLKNSLKDLAENNGENYVVTEEDVQKMLSKLSKDVRGNGE